MAISRKDGTFLGAPDDDTTLRDGDVLIIYGRAEVLSKLEKRLKGAKGNREHQEIWFVDFLHSLEKYSTL